MKIIYITLVLVIINIAILYVIIKSYNNKYTFEKIIKILIRQCARWAIASEQDKTPLVKLLHANYSTGYLWSLKDIASDDEITKTTRIDMKKFTQNILKIQDKSTLYAVKKCPVFGPKETYLLSIANSTI